MTTLLAYLHKARAFLEPVVLAGLILIFVASLAQVGGQSMQPTLTPNNWVLVSRWPVWAQRLGLISYERGDLVVFKVPDETRELTVRLGPWTFGRMTVARRVIKRVVALENERVMLERGVVIINGTPFSEPYVSYLGGGDAPEIQVPSDHVFVLGDNRMPLGSVDSRHYGAIPVQALEGRIDLIVYPNIRWIR